MYVLNLARYTTSLKIKTHAHHIVMENGRGPQARFDVLAAKAVLRKDQIDPCFSKENLIWTSNFSHTTDYAREVRLRLESADALGGRAEVLNALEKIGRDFKRRSHRGGGLPPLRWRVACQRTERRVRLTTACPSGRCATSWWREFARSLASWPNRTG